MSDSTLAETVAAEVERIGGGAPISVTERNGVVTLTGVVRDAARRTLIEQDLLQVPGVLDVRNHLHVPLPAGEPAVQLRALLEHAGVQAGGIEIGVDEGVVTLAGDAETWFDRDAAERLAWMLPGVREVTNRIDLPAGAPAPDGDDNGEGLD